VLAAAQDASARNRFMLALAYDAALRREELCALEVGDLDPARRLLRVRAEVTKGRRERVVPYSAPTGRLYAAYLPERRRLSRERGRLFRSASDRNRGAPLSIWTWSKVVEGLAARAAVPRFTTHTLRPLRLTDLARAGWDVHELATFAGHRSVQSTLQYIHLSGRELAAKLERGMAQLHAWRVRQLEGLLP
jgi:integrase